MQTLKLRFMLLALEYMMYWGTDTTKLNQLNQNIHKVFVDRVRILHDAIEVELQTQKEG